jgi:hypothetical protein
MTFHNAKTIVIYPSPVIDKDIDYWKEQDALTALAAVTTKRSGKLYGRYQLADGAGAECYCVELFDGIPAAKELLEKLDQTQLAIQHDSTFKWCEVLYVLD